MSIEKEIRRIEIRRFCNQLADIWVSNCPEWRFGQLIDNVLTDRDRDLEDKRMLGLFYKYFGQRLAAELSPCPFCGEKPVMHDNGEPMNKAYNIACCNRNCAMQPLTGWCQPKEFAISIWENRKGEENKV